VSVIKRILLKKHSTPNATRAIIFSLASLLLVCFQSAAQKKNASYRLNIHRTAVPIKVDGSIDDVAWQEADSAYNFYMVLPMDTSYATVKTEVRMCYDDHSFTLSPPVIKVNPAIIL
jgi:hypothetical protein